jgi:MFS family permease
VKCASESAIARARPTGRPLGPLSIRPFRLLFMSALTSDIGVWMESVMAGFVMASLTHVPSLVAALPLAASLPGLIFALPAGAVSDAADRRLVLLSAKTLFLFCTVGLALVTLAGGLSPFALIVFAAALGTVGTFSASAWWATLGDLVPEPLLSRALSLDGFQRNIGQIVGPVVGGFLLASIGAGGMFAAAAALMTAIVGFLVIWRGRHQSRLSTPGEGASEKMLGAVTAGARYLANAPAVQVTCFRAFLFVLPAAPWARCCRYLPGRTSASARVVRRRIGASRWGLFEDASTPGHFLESFVVPSWGDYLRQRSRYTTADLRVLDAAMALDASPNGPTVSHFVHPESAFSYRRRARWRRLISARYPSVSRETSTMYL